VPIPGLLSTRPTPALDAIEDPAAVLAEEVAAYLALYNEAGRTRWGSASRSRCIAETNTHFGPQVSKEVDRDHGA